MGLFLCVSWLGNLEDPTVTIKYGVLFYFQGRPPTLDKLSKKPTTSLHYRPLELLVHLVHQTCTSALKNYHRDPLRCFIFPMVHVRHVHFVRRNTPQTNVLPSSLAPRRFQFGGQVGGLRFKMEKANAHQLGDLMITLDKHEPGNSRRGPALTSTLIAQTTLTVVVADMFVDSDLTQG